MKILFTLLSDTVFLLLCLAEAAVFARVILGYFLSVNDSALYRVLVFFTEPFLLPIRGMLDKIKIGGGLLDLSAAVFSAVLIPVLALLPAFT